MARGGGGAQVVIKRGPSCRENTKLTEWWDHRWGAERNGDNISDPDRYWPNNSNNVLKNNWLRKQHYSSWAKLRYTDINEHLRSEDRTCGTQEYENHNHYLYGQFNCFLQLYSTADPFINNLSLASITCRRHVTVEGVDHIVADHDGDSFYVHKMFVLLNDVYSTPIMTCAFKSLQTRTRIPKKQKRRQQDDHNEEDIEEDEVINNENNGKRKRNRRNLAAEEKTNSNNANESFEIQVSKTVRELKEMAFPYYVFNNSDVSKAFKNFAKPNNCTAVSYIVMLEMHRNRKYIRYNHEKDTLYRSKIFDAQSKCFTIRETCTLYH